MPRIVKASPPSTNTDATHQHTPLVRDYRDFIQLVVQPDFCRQCFETVYPLPPTMVAGWRRGIVVSGVRRMNEVNARRARLVPGWVTDFGRVYHLGM